MKGLSPGQLFQARYRIEKELGSGGMGTVYLATQIDAGRPVAIKLLEPTRVGDEDDFKRFVRECKLLSRISHQNVVVFYSHGITADKIPYSVSEYLSGQNLEELLWSAGRLDWRRAARIGIQIALGLEHAHALGIVHRDLKPSNIMINDQPEVDTVKIIDFGLAKLMDAAEITQLTMSGEIVGTVYYMSPEQCRGKEMDHRTDVYSLACVIFELISGKKLFLQSSPIEVLRLQCEESPDSSISELSGLAPDSLLELLKKMLSKSKATRPASMQAVAASLQEILQMETAKTNRASSKQTVVGKTAWKQYLLYAAILILSLALILISSNAIQNKKEQGVVAAQGPRTLILQRNFFKLRSDARGLSEQDQVVLYQRWLEKYRNYKGAKQDILQAVSDIARIKTQQLFQSNKGMDSFADLQTYFNMFKHEYIDFGNPIEREAGTVLFVNSARIDHYKGNTNAAKETLNRLYSDWMNTKLSGDPNSGLELAVSLIACNEYSKAEKLIRKVTSVKAGHFELLFAGDISVLNNNLVQAKSYYNDCWKSIEEEVRRRFGDKKPMLTGGGMADWNSLLDGSYVISGMLKTGKPLKSWTPFAPRNTVLVKRMLYLDAIRARSMFKSTIQLAKAEIAVIPDYKYEEMKALVDLAAQVDDSSLVECNRLTLVILEKQLASTVDQTARYDISYKIACNLCALKEFGKARSFFQRAYNDYANQKQFDEQMLCLKSIYLANLYPQMRSSEFLRNALNRCKEHASAVTPELKAALSWYAALANTQNTEQAFKRCQEDFIKLPWETALTPFLKAQRWSQARQILQSRNAPAKSYVELADCELRAGCNKQALEDYERAYDIYRKTGFSEMDDAQRLECMALCRLSSMSCKTARQ